MSYFRLPALPKKPRNERYRRGSQAHHRCFSSKRKMPPDLRRLSYVKANCYWCNLWWGDARGGECLRRNPSSADLDGNCEPIDLGDGYEPVNPAGSVASRSLGLGSGPWLA
jgi:hypothetical protein